jgi:hypothetical protein
MARLKFSGLFVRTLTTLSSATTFKVQTQPGQSALANLGAASDHSRLKLTAVITTVQRLGFVSTIFLMALLLEDMCCVPGQRDHVKEAPVFMSAAFLPHS